MREPLILEYDCVDLIIRNFSLTEIDRHLQVSKELLSELAPNHPLKAWWQRKVNDLTFASEMAEYCILNGIPTIDLKPETKTRERGLFALEKCRELEGRLTQLKLDLEGLMSNYTDYAFPLLKEIESYLKSKRKHKY